MKSSPSADAIQQKVTAEIMQQPKRKTFADLSQEDIANAIKVMSFTGTNWWHCMGGPDSGPFDKFEDCCVDAISKELRRPEKEDSGG